jgi:hypothetical protein
LALVKEIRRVRDTYQTGDTASPVSDDPVEFAKSVGLDPDPYQADMLTSQHPRKMLLWSRQSGKSTVGALLATHKAVSSIGSTTLVVAPSEDQAKELFRKCRAFVAEARIVNRSETQTGLELVNGSRIVVRAAIERTTRGYAVDLLIVDEAAQVDDQAYFALRPSLMRTRGDQILLSTPRGRRGFFSDLWHGDNEWEKSRVTADDANVDPDLLDREREELHEAWFRQEYYVEFMSREHQVYTDEIVHLALRGDHRPVDLGGIWL